MPVVDLQRGLVEGEGAVPDALVARVAEWSLGDTVELPRTLDEVVWG